MSDEQSQPLEPQWCLVANVRKFIRKGEGRQEIAEGTRHFSGGTKVYCFPVLWGDGYEQIKVIGKHRGSPKLVVMIVHWRYLTNWRVKLIYEPRVLKLLQVGDRPAWSRWQDQAPQQLAENYAVAMREREIIMDELDDLSGMEPKIGGALSPALLIPGIGGERVINHIRWLLRDEKPSTRAKVVGALGKLDKPQVVSVLREHLDREVVFYVREACLRALERIGTPEALAAIELWQRDHGANGLS
jgi:hypothetical protein